MVRWSVSVMVALCAVPCAAGTAPADPPPPDACRVYAASESSVPVRQHRPGVIGFWKMGSIGGVGR